MRRLAIVFLLFAAAVHADDRPVLTALPGNVVGMTLPVSILRNGEVRRRLGGGLTTTIVVIAHDDDGTAGGGRFEIRFDLWDEVFNVRRTDFDGHLEQARVSSAAELERWWHTSLLRVLATSRPRARLNIEVSVLPFSAAEQQDARRWLAKSASVGASRGGNGVVEALIGSTIQAKPLVTWRWSAELAMK